MSGSQAFFILAILFFFIFIPLWKIYEKADQAGWALLVPLYNEIVILRIVGKPDWFVLLFFIPFLNILLEMWMFVLIAQSFGKSVWFGLGMCFLPFIFLPILAFGNDEYLGPVDDGIFCF